MYRYIVLFGSADISIQYVYSVSAIFCMGVCQFQIVWSALIKGQQHEIFSIKIFFFFLSLAYQNDYFVISPWISILWICDQFKYVVSMKYVRGWIRGALLCTADSATLWNWLKGQLSVNCFLCLFNQFQPCIVYLLPA